MDSKQLVAEYKEALSKFNRASERVRFLNEQLRADFIRYDRAKKDNKGTFLFNLKTRIDATMHERKIYYAYTVHKAQQMDDISHKLAQTSPDAMAQLTAEIQGLAIQGPQPDVQWRANVLATPRPCQYHNRATKYSSTNLLFTYVWLRCF